MSLTGLAFAVVDLVLGGLCAGCAGEAGLLCRRCRTALNGPLRVVTRQRIDVPVYAVADYSGAVASVVLAHKERGRLALAQPLGDALGRAGAGLLRWTGTADGGEFALVPVPSVPAATRRRGHDPLLRISRRAAVELRRRGICCAVVPALRHRRTVSDQAGLGSALRALNMAGSMVTRRSAAARLSGQHVVVVDDVVTTGATLGEAVRALRAAGVAVCGGAVVANAPAGRSVGRHTAAPVGASR